MDSIEVMANGLRFRVLRWEPKTASRSLLLLHGLASNARIWELVAPLLTEDGLTCYAPDQRGHGQSDKPDEGYDDLAVIAEDIGGLIHALGLDHPVLVGHSWGASGGLCYAANNTQGPASPAGLVLVDGGIGQLSAYPGASWESVRGMLTPPRLAGVPLESLRARLSEPDRKWPMDPGAVDISLANFEILDNGTVRPRLTFERHMRLVRSIWEFRTYDQFPRLRCPVLMIPAKPPEPWDPQESGLVQLKEQGVARAKASITDLRVEWMDSTVHDIPLQRPRALADRILEFVRSLA
jgi:pimeloyl-ACP methyl ester carboxylesterase